MRACDCVRASRARVCIRACVRTRAGLCACVFVRASMLSLARVCLWPLSTLTLRYFCPRPLVPPPPPKKKRREKGYNFIYIYIKYVGRQLFPSYPPPPPPPPSARDTGHWERKGKAADGGGGGVGGGGAVKLQALVYDVLPSGGRCRKAMLGVWGAV